MVAASVELANADLLDVGCGIGAYSVHLAQRGARVFGLEPEWPRAVAARQAGVPVVVAVSERLPFADQHFDVVLLHEVLEHVADDRLSVVESVRVLKKGGRAVVFVPNRWWPFETHGFFWRGRYHFGNVPFLNYLPDPLRNALAPHVRVYTGRSLLDLVHELPVRILEHRQIYPGYDSLAARRPLLGALARRLSYWLERTPLRRFGLSHLLVIEKVADGPHGDHC